MKKIHSVFGDCFIYILSVLTLCVPGGGQFCPSSPVSPFVAKIYFLFDILMVCKLSPWSYPSFKTFLRLIGPLLIKLGQFLHGQLIIVCVIKSLQTHNFGMNPTFDGILLSF